MSRSYKNYTALLINSIFIFNEIVASTRAAQPMAALPAIALNAKISITI